MKGNQILEYAPPTYGKVANDDKLKTELARRARVRESATDYFRAHTIIIGMRYDEAQTVITKAFEAGYEQAREELIP